MPRRGLNFPLCSEWQPPALNNICLSEQYETSYRLEKKLENQEETD